MAGTSPTVGNSFVRQLPTPSPYSFSVTSSGRGARLQIERLSLSIRFSALVLCFVSAVTLTTRSGKRARSLSSFTDSPELVYCFITSMVTFVYSALQLFKGVCDISYGAVLIPDRISDYLSFVLDQVIHQTDNTPSLQKAAIVSVTMSFAAFSVMSACTLLSGYKLCKRIIW